MKNTEFYSREQLMTMPLVALRGVDIDTPEQASMVQEVVNIKLASLPVQRPIYRKDVPDIQTPEEEARWQTIINQREAKIRNQGIPSSEPVTEPVVEPVVPAPAEPEAPVVPDESGMAQPTGEGDPVTFSAGVTTSGAKPRRLT